MAEQPPLTVTALAASAQLGGTERVLLDFATRAFEYDIAVRVVTPRDGPLLEILDELGIETAVVPGPAAMLRGSQRPGALHTLPGAVAGLMLWTRRLARHPFFTDVDVVYAVAFKPYVATAWYRRAPVVWHLHEFPPALTGRAWKAIARRTPNRLIANSEAVGRAWAKGGPDPTALRVIPNGVDLDRFRPRARTGWIHERLGLTATDRIIGMPAVLAKWKGQLLVLDAFERMAQQHPDTHLVFVGGSIYDTAAERRYESELTTAIADVPLGLRQRVHRLGFQDKIEVVYPEFDLAVHYSTRPEPFGRVVLEAMACAVPVLAAAEGGPTEIVTEGGWLVRPRAPQALATAMDTALEMPEERLREVGQWGRVRAEDHYSARRFARDVADQLRAACSS